MLIFGSVCAQQGNDVVELRNGSIYRGTIIEKIPTQHVLFKTMDGRQMTFPMDEVKRAKMNFSSKVKIARPPVEVKNGYFNNTDVGVMFGAEGWGGISARPTINMVNGYQFGRYSVGAGLGFATFQRQHYMPLFADARVYLREKEAFSPYLAVQAGYSIGLSKEYEYYPYSFDLVAEPEKQRANGLYGGVQLGIRKYTSNKFGYNISMGGRLQRNSVEYTDWLWSNGRSVPVNIQEVSRMFRSELRIGIYFN